MYLEKGRMLGHFKSNVKSASGPSAEGNPKKEGGDPETVGPIADAGHPEKNYE